MPLHSLAEKAGNCFPGKIQALFAGVTMAHLHVPAGWPSSWPRICLGSSVFTLDVSSNICSVEF